MAGQRQHTESHAQLRLQELKPRRRRGPALTVLYRSVRCGVCCLHPLIQWHAPLSSLPPSLLLLPVGVIPRPRAAERGAPAVHVRVSGFQRDGVVTGHVSVPLNQPSLLNCVGNADNRQTNPATPRNNRVVVNTHTHMRARARTHARTHAHTHTHTSSLQNTHTHTHPLETTE